MYQDESMIREFIQSMAMFKAYELAGNKSCKSCGLPAVRVARFSYTTVIDCCNNCEPKDPYPNVHNPKERTLSFEDLLARKGIERLMRMAKVE